MTGKVIFQAILSIIAGAAFIAVGIYFLSSRFLQKLNEAAADKSEEACKKNAFRAKGSGLTALSLGVLTLVWGLMLFTFPQIAAPLALVYMIFLIAAFGCLMLVFK